MCLHARRPPRPRTAPPDRRRRCRAPRRAAPLSAAARRGRTRARSAGSARVRARGPRAGPPTASVARAMAYGRRRAAARLAGPGYTPHPGWRHLIAPGWRVLVDQAEALAVIDGPRRRPGLARRQTRRLDARSCASSSTPWTGTPASSPPLTAHRLGAAGARAPRTVSRVIAWARDIGLLVVVEHGACAEFLGTDHGRTPTYALVTNTPAPPPPQSRDGRPDPPTRIRAAHHGCGRKWRPPRISR